MSNSFLTRKQQKHAQFITRRIIAQTQNELGGTDLDLIDTSDYRDIFSSIHPDFDEPNSSLTYLTGVRQ